MLVDSHCHLDRLDFDKLGCDLGEAVASAERAGVHRLLCVCISAENRIKVATIAENFPNVFASAGVHPSDVAEQVVSVEELIHWCDHPKVVALGESGLDYHYSADTAAIQIESFANHLQAGRQLGLPVIVHTRNAKQDTMDVIKQHGCVESAGVMHCFTEDWEMAREALDRNFYISISGIVTFRNADQLRDVAKKVPMDRLMVETDSPYLAPVPYRGKTNQPAYVREVAEYVAQLRGMSYEALAEQTSENFFRLFSRAS